MRLRRSIFSKMSKLDIRGGLCLAMFFFLFLTQKTVVAQNSLSGKIADEAGQPLSGATVFLPDLRTGVTAGADGSFRLSKLPGGEFLVEISFVGYEKAVEKVAISGETHRDFTLHEAHTEAREVIVTGLSKATEKRQSSLSVDVLKSGDLFQKSATSLFQSIATTPGVGAIGTGQAVAKPVIRGLGHSRVLVVQDGIRQEGQQWGDEHGVEVDEFGVDRVEILKGPASLVFGSDGMGGVVSLQSAPPVEEGTALCQILSNYQSNGDLRAISGSAAAQKNGWSGTARATAKQAGDFREPVDGAVFNSGFSEKDASANLGLRRSRGVTSLSASYFSQKIELPEGERDSTGAFLTDASPFQKIDHLKFSVNNSTAFGGSLLKTTVGWQHNRRREFEEPGPPGLFLDLQTMTFDVKLIQPGRRGWERTVGIGAMWQANRNRGSEFLIPEYRQGDAGAVIFCKKTFGRTHFSAGLRGDLRHLATDALVEDGSTRFSPITRRFGSASASTGISHELNKRLTLKINASKGFRSPNAAELATNGVHEGTFRYELGNAHLKPEDNYQLDLGLELATRHVNLTASVFDNLVDHFIFLEKLRSAGGGDSIPDPNDPVAAYGFRQNAANLWGGEITIDLHPHPLDWLHFENSFAAVVARQLDGEGRYLPFIPAPVWRSELRVDLGSAGRLRGIFADAEAAHYFPQKRALTENDFETPSKSYTICEAGAGFEWRLSAKFAPRIALRATNLFDMTYQSHLNRLRYAPVNPATGRPGIFDPGRSFSVKVVLPLTTKI